MPTFTTIVKYEPDFNIPAYSIHTVIIAVELTMLGESPRGARCSRSYHLADKDDQKFLVCTITLRNMRGTVLDHALVISEQREIAAPKYHATGGAPIACRGCASRMFYDVDRSLDYNNHICAQCGAHTLTETGASA